MHDLVILLVHIIATLARLLGPGGTRSVVAESVLLKQQLLILNRSRQRSPNLRPSDRLVAGLCALLVRPARLIRSAIVLKPSTLLSLHQALTESKVSATLLTEAKAQARSKGTVQRTHRSRCANKTAQSHLGLSANCSADYPGFRHPNRQRRCPQDSRQSLSAGTRFWSLLADLRWASEGQPLEYRSVPVRISHFADSVGLGCHGSIYPQDHRLRHPCRSD